MTKVGYCSQKTGERGIGYLKGKKAIIMYKGDVVEIRPFKKSDLAKYFDKVEVDLKSDLFDWHKVRKELQSV